MKNTQSINIRPVNVTPEPVLRDRQYDEPWTPDDIYQIYVGGDRVCRCGCAGNYYTPSDKSWKRNLNRFIKLVKTQPWDVEDEGSYINITTSSKGSIGKAITVYFDKVEVA